MLLLLGGEENEEENENEADDLEEEWEDMGEEDRQPANGKK